MDRHRALQQQLKECGEEVRKLLPLKERFNRELADAKVSVRVDYEKLLEQWESTQKQDAEKNKRYARVAKTLRGERIVLLDELALTKGLLHTARVELAIIARKQVLDGRQQKREETRRQHEMSLVEQHAEDVECAAALQVASAKRDAEAAEQWTEECLLEVEAARQEALEEREAAAEAAAERDHTVYQSMLLTRQVDRAKTKAKHLTERIKLYKAPLASGRSAQEWAEMRADAQRKAGERDRYGLRGFLTAHAWRAHDLAAVLDESGLLASLFETKQGWRIYFAKVSRLHQQLERHDFGVRLGLFLHYDMKLTLEKIQRYVEAACKEFNQSSNRYKNKPWLINPFNTNEKLMTPRICPARSKLEPITKELASHLGVEWSDNGLLAFRSFEIVMQEVLSRDTGKLTMPALPEFYGGLRLPIIISRDATGKGSLQFTTVAARTPWASKSAQWLHIFGFGNCGDDRSGSTRLFDHNLATINRVVEAAAENRPTPVEHGGEQRLILYDPYFTDDVSALRHGEHLANSGWCGCHRDVALRQLPLKPVTVANMRKLVNGDTGTCRELSCHERDVLSHNPLPGKEIPEPCIAPLCKFGHNRSTAAQEYLDMLAMESILAADTSKKGKQKFCAWRMKHAWKGPVPHLNVPQGLYGKPMLRHHFQETDSGRTTPGTSRFAQDSVEIGHQEQCFGRCAGADQYTAQGVAARARHEDQRGRSRAGGKVVHGRIMGELLCRHGRQPWGTHRHCNHRHDHRR